MSRKISYFIEEFMKNHQNDFFHVLEFKIDYCASREIVDQYGVHVTVPFLNLYLGNLTTGLSVSEALYQADRQNNFDVYYDGVDNVNESEFELELTRVLRPGIKTTRLDYAELTSLIEEALDDCRHLTQNIHTIFMHCVDEFEITFLKTATPELVPCFNITNTDPANSELITAQMERFAWI